MPMPSGPDPQVGVLREKLADAERKIAELDHRVSRLTRVCEVLREAIRKQGVVTDDDLVAIEEGLATKKAVAPLCRRCGKTLQHGMASCIYCGSLHGEVL
jgi:hypothetical protein